MMEQSISIDGTRKEVLENARTLIDSVTPEQSMIAMVITHSEEDFFQTTGTQLVVGTGAEDVIQALCGYQESILEKIAQYNPQTEQAIRMNLISRLSNETNSGGN